MAPPVAIGRIPHCSISSAIPPVSRQNKSIPESHIAERTSETRYIDVWMDGDSAQVEVVEVEATQPEAEDEEEENAEGEGEVGREGGVVEGGDYVLGGKGGEVGENVEVEHGGDGLYPRNNNLASREVDVMPQVSTLTVSLTLTLSHSRTLALSLAKGHELAWIQTQKRASCKECPSAMLCMQWDGMQLRYGTTWGL
ncbi:hypothetical protein BGX38DRAFT_1146057 [Terfezia claveryi]|nr:hypothetical protein BGX38DRAFT_1146057 [Terfezia claveryi]